MTRATGARRAPQAYRPGRSRRRISPGAVMLAIALGGSVLFALFTITVRDASQIPLLASGAAVLGIAFGALAVYSVRATWYAGLAGRNQRAMVMALAGGMAAIVGAGCLAGAIILFMLAQAPA
jgi:MFS family permease